MPSKKVTMRASMSNQTSHFGIMGGLYNRKISGRSSTNRVTSRLEIPAGADAGLRYMKMHNLLSKNPLGSGGVGKMFTIRPRGSGFGNYLKNKEKTPDSLVNDDRKGVESDTPWTPSVPLTICFTIDDSIIMSDPGKYDTSHPPPGGYFLSLLFDEKSQRRKNKNTDGSDSSACAMSLFVTGGFGLKDIFLNSGYMHSIGNEIGNHTVTHGNGMAGGGDTMNMYTTEMWKKELNDMNLMLQTWSGVPEQEIRAFRKPELFKDASSSLPYWQAIVDIATDNSNITYYETSITYDPIQTPDTSMVFVYKPFKISDFSNNPIQFKKFSNDWFQKNLLSLPPNLYIYPMPNLGFISDPTDPGHLQEPSLDMMLPRFNPGGFDSSFNEIGMQRIIDEFISGWQEEQPSVDPTLFISLHEQNFTKDFVDWINIQVGKGNIKLKTIVDAFKNDISWNIPGDFPNSKNYSSFNISQFSTGNWICGENCDVSVSLIPMIGSQNGPYQTSADTCSVPQGLAPADNPNEKPGASNDKNALKCTNAGCLWETTSPWGFAGCISPDISSSIHKDLACKSGIITGNLTDICNNCYMNTSDTVEKIPILEYEKSIDFITNHILLDHSIKNYIPPNENTSGTFWFGNPLGNTTKPQSPNRNLVCQNYCPTPKLTDISGCLVSKNNFCNYNYYSIARSVKQIE